MIKFNDFYCLLEAFDPSYRKDAVFLSITVYFSIFVYIFYAHFSILSSTNLTLSTFTKKSKCGAGGLLKFMNIYKITFTNFFDYIIGFLSPVLFTVLSCSVSSN